LKVTQRRVAVSNQEDVPGLRSGRGTLKWDGGTLWGIHSRSEPLALSTLHADLAGSVSVMSYSELGDGRGESEIVPCGAIDVRRRRIVQGTLWLRDGKLTSSPDATFEDMVDKGE
jgi:hypothetical protein